MNRGDKSSKRTALQNLMHFNVKKKLKVGQKLKALDIFERKMCISSQCATPRIGYARFLAPPSLLNPHFLLIRYAAYLVADICFTTIQCF